MDDPERTTAAAPPEYDEAERTPRPDTPGAAPARDRAPGQGGRGLLGVRPTRSAWLAGVLTLGLGLALSTQIGQTRDRGLESLRETELIGILDTVTSRADRLEAEARDLEAERARLSQGQAGADEARRRAQERVDDLGVLAGTVAAQGPGVVVTLESHGGELSAGTLLDLTQELRDAGAEAIQIGDVRVVASTSFVDGADGTPTVGGRPVTWPVTVVAVGDPGTLASALAIPGGLEETVRQLGGRALVRRSDRVLVKALHVGDTPRYARPVTPSQGTSTTP